MMRDKFLGASMLLALCACALDAPALSSTATNPLGTFEQFEAGLTRDPVSGSYIVEGDLGIFGRDELHAYWARSEQGALTLDQNDGRDNQWTASEQHQLSYCIGAGFGLDTERMRIGIETAAREWERRADVHFVHYAGADGYGCTVDSANVLFNVRLVHTDTTTFARGFFPHDARPKRELLITQSMLDLADDPRWLTGILGHELGHILGFRHEFVRPEDVTDCHRVEDGDWRPLTVYDADSIMHYFYCAGGFDWTVQDRLGAALTYGPSSRGRTDLLWRNGTALSIWYLRPDGSLGSYQNPPPIARGWTVLGTGDFNGDRLSDLAFLDPLTARVHVWLMNGATVLQQLQLGLAPQGSSPLTVADVTQDAVDDIVWRSSNGSVTVWAVAQGGATFTSAVMAYSIPPAYSLVAVGDINADHRQDLLWRSGTALMLWEMNGRSPRVTNLVNTIPEGWQAAGTGDVDRDGVDDVVWWNASLGRTSIWFMAPQGGIKKHKDIIGPSTSWVPQGVGDVDGDDTADLFWRDTNSGAVSLWTLRPDGTVGASTQPWSASSGWNVTDVGTFD